MSNELSATYAEVRARSLLLCEGLETDDLCTQPFTEASPPKWHLAHTTWFFETFILLPFMEGYERCNPTYGVLFNSYYEGIGQQWPRQDRGKLSRPTVEEVLRYRDHVDMSMLALLASLNLQEHKQIASRTLLGLHHEQQHQELLVTDIKGNFGLNPLAPAYEGADMERALQDACDPLEFLEFEGGLVSIGVAPEREEAVAFSGFVFDNESPRHKVYLNPFSFANRLITNGEYLDFISDGGYRRPELWLAEAWNRIRAEGWTAPLYWSLQDGDWCVYSLSGKRPLDQNARVSHVSFYEADAFARWRGARLPSEAEWEYSLGAEANSEVQEAFGRVWQWTSSAYLPYPGYRQWAGAVGEYNGKFMSGQMVLRGSSCVTPKGHARASYRNFFYPWDRWQYAGIRLAKDFNTT